MLESIVAAAEGPGSNPEPRATSVLLLLQGLRVLLLDDDEASLRSIVCQMQSPELGYSGEAGEGGALWCPRSSPAARLLPTTRP